MQTETPSDSGGSNPASASAMFQSVQDFARILALTLAAALFLKLFVVEAFRIPSPSMERTLIVGDFILVNKLAYGIRTPRMIPFTGIPLPSFVLPAWARANRGDVIVFEFPGNADERVPHERVNFIKRCIGLPGDVVEIREGRVYVNGQALTFPRTGMPPADINGVWHSMVRTYPDGAGFTDIRYGPLRVPRTGDTIEIDERTVDRWRIFLEREGHRVVRRFGSVFIDGQEAGSCIVKRDYYFVMGDNRDNSLDSRFWGFVPDDLVAGSALAVYWSWDPAVDAVNLSDKLASIRWSRIGTLVR